jgi:hypothetical protein
MAATRNTPTRTLHTFYCDELIWRRASARAHAENTTVSDVLRDALTDYAAKAPAA